MKQFIYSCCLFCLAFLFSSCSNTYMVLYQTQLKDSNEKTLEIRDSLFIIDLHPVPNGIYFRIQNLGQQQAILKWDNCYFIGPDGNSSKAANSDLMNMPEELLNKDNGQTLIPPLAFIERFTTSNTKLKSFTKYNIFGSSQTEYQNNTKFGGFFDFVSRIGYSVSSTQNNSTAIISRQFTTETYWPYIYDLSAGSNDESIQYLVLNKTIDYLKSNDNLGLGLVIEYAGILHNYRFNFKFSAVSVYEVKKSQNILRYHATKQDDWKWEKAKEEKLKDEKPKREIR